MASLTPPIGSTDDPVYIYSNGICYCSVCSNITDPVELTRIVNVINPTGLHSQWRLSKGKTFGGGEPNPSPCEVDDTRKHYLFEC